VPHNKSLQLTAGSCGFINVFGLATGFGLSGVFRQTPRRARPDLRSGQLNFFVRGCIAIVMVGNVGIGKIVQSIRRDTMRFKVVLEASDEGGYTVYVPSLPGCISEGETVEESLKNIQEAIELYLEPVEDDLVMEENALVQEIEL